MSSLADYITVNRSYGRSTNLERDAGTSSALNSYLLTGRVLEMVERIAAALNNGTGGAWSVTGPYGSGKSSLGVFLADLLASQSADSQNLARQLIAAIDPRLAGKVDTARARFDNKVFIDGLVTAQSEPVTHTITRALYRAMVHAFGKTPGPRVFPEIRLLEAALADLDSSDPRRTGPSPASLLAVATALADRAPLLLVVDEFGKNLEAAQQRPDADLYLLQLLAEAAQTERGAPILLVTMQHLAFGDYALADNAQQREWAKIQGRFEDVVFVDAPAQSRQLITSVFTHTAPLTERVRTWATIEAAAMRDVQLFELADADVLGACYPLHPTTLAVLPELCRRYGQNERSLFGFLAGSEPTSVPQLLNARSVASRGPLPTIGLADVYNYFATTAVTATARTSRWAEITVKLRDVAGLPTEQIEVAKAVAILNLVASNGPLRASPALLERSVHNSPAHLSALVEANVIVHRNTTDEYRIWHGSDVDLESHLDNGRRQAATLDPLTLLNITTPLSPAIAAGHSMRTDTLRTFERRYLAAGADIEETAANSVYDGRIYLALGTERRVPDVVACRPICVHDTDLIEPLITAARELYAHDTVLSQPAVVADWVARNEVRERRADTERRLMQALDDAWNSGTTTLITQDGHRRLTSVGKAVLSEAADIAYTRTVAIRNETLNRVEISSIGAKARRLLILAMLKNETLEQLGLEGHGPEVAMYRAVLQATGIHGRNERTGDWQIRPPSDPQFKVAWDAVIEQLRAATDRRINLDDLYATLQLPPIGMKSGPIPVLLHAALIATSDEVALYEHGTFKPALTDDVSDRLVRNPGHFEVKHYANARPGARRQVVEQLADKFAIPPRFRKSRVANVLAIVGALVNTIGQLPPITRNATDLAEQTIAIRDAIVRATEPDQLLFVDLPRAAGLNLIGARIKDWRHLDTFTSRLVDAISELNAHFDHTLGGLEAELLNISAESGRDKLAGQANLIVDEILAQDLRTFTLALADNTFDNARWIENIATNVTRTAVRHWNPSHRRQYSSELAGRLAAFRRIQILHHEARTHHAEAFDARRITVTKTTGEEHAVLVALDEADRARNKILWDTYIDALEPHYTSRTEAEKVAFGYASERILGTDTKAASTADEPSDLKAANHD
jgi:hypothetical protein